MGENTDFDPQSEYARRLDLRRQADAAQETLDGRIAVARLMAAAAAGLLAWLAFVSAHVPFWWTALPALGFILLVIGHERVRRKRRRLRRAIQYYLRGIGRLENRWAGAGNPGDRFLDPSHPYAEDLDLFGRGSLFELLCAARTQAGESRLATWLLAPAPPSGVADRQAAAGELSGRLDFREDLATCGEDVVSGIDPGELIAWGEAPPWPVPSGLRIIAAAVAGIATITLILWLGFDRARSIFLLAVLAEAVLMLYLWRAIRTVLTAAERPAQNLALLAEILGRLEQADFTGPCLRKLRTALAGPGPSPSKQIAGLNRIIALRRQLFAPLAALLLWDIQMAFAVESWRKQSGRSIAGWLGVAGEMEALCSLAQHAYEHPSDPFPEIAQDGPLFEAEAIGHPLLPEPACVRNDIRLSGEMRVLVVSGSNMSGKSTLLRTIGINAVLALAGGPVRARRLKLSPLAVGASIQRRDSLQAGTSRFYEEILRLRRLVEITEGPLPLIFLLDELLHGTNSHDRRIGADALVRDLLRRNAVGLLTTHDLALSQIAEDLAPGAANVHFEDTVQDGRLVFDYRLRPGIVRRSNALALMRAVGLPI